VARTCGVLSALSASCHLVSVSCVDVTRLAIRLAGIFVFSLFRRHVHSHTLAVYTGDDNSPRLPVVPWCLA